MRLYYSPGSCALSPHIVAREAGLTIELEKVVFGDGVRTTEPHNENYYEVNPYGYVPALRLNSGEVMRESAAIIQYLSDQVPAAKLTPTYQTTEYYKTLEWLTFITSELHKNFGPTFRKDIPDAERVLVVDKLKKRFEWLNTYLEGKEYLVGSAFTIADAYCFTILRWSPRAAIELTTYPNIAAYFARIHGRPAVQVALKEEGLE